MFRMIYTTIAVILVTFCWQKLVEGTGTCTLDGMKRLAAEACEHMFQSNFDYHLQRKRELTNEIDKSKQWFPEHHTKKWKSHLHAVRIRRKDYPKEGFLLLDHHHAKILHKMEHDPEYMILPIKSHLKKYAMGMHSSKMGSRSKRAKSRISIQVPYCCVNKCHMDHFCRR